MKKLAGIATAVYIFFANTPFLYAQTTDKSLDPCKNAQGPLKAACDSKGLGIGQVLGFIVTIVFVVAILIALWFLIQGGIKWIFSEGDADKVGKARNQIVAAIVGLIIVFLAFFILNLALGLFNMSLFDLKLPTLTGQ